MKHQGTGAEGGFGARRPGSDTARMPRSILMLMSQLPHDPASGAPRSDRTVCEFLARAGFRVRCLATTATEQRLTEPASDFLRRAGIDFRIESADDSLGERPVLRFVHRGIDYTLLDTADHTMESWIAPHNAQFVELLRRDIERRGVPDVTYLYGGRPEERERRRLLRQAGSIIVFTLHNWGYLHPRAFKDTDAVLVPSRHVGEVYREALGIDTIPMPVPLLEEDVLATTHRPTFVTFINPTNDKGVMVVARIAEEICSKRADIPFLIVNARQTEANLIRAGLAAGFDLRRHRQIMFSPGVPRPADIYAVTKVLLVPSVWPEPAGRVTAEAMLNGIPTLVSDRGGVAETSHGAADVILLPPGLTPHNPRPLTQEEARPWVRRIEQLFDDSAEYTAASERCAIAGEHYREAALTARYADFFGTVSHRYTPIVPSVRAR